MKYTEKNSKDKVARRLKLIEGQVRGLQKMIESDEHCIAVITQTSAVRHALSNIEDILLENHLECCVEKQMTSGEAVKARKEILDVYKLKRK